MRTKFRFYWLFFFILLGCFDCFSQVNDRSIRIFEKKKVENPVDASSWNDHLLVFPSPDSYLMVEINDQKSWIVDVVNWNEWVELPENTLVMIQPVAIGRRSEVIPLHKRDYKPFLLSSFTLNSFAKEDFESNMFSLSWGIAENGVISAQTSKKIISNNCCTNGTCSLIISFNKKNSKIEHITLPN
ncbi:hypothetical protein NAT51_13220 [Flavobacterium amniphilum]|uniref:hypothetical protein n=1 Tax=Flavobacterium amniphilum TaxID=1834035 RepID=UPI00202A3387|nr:hypothetical protein [Flavobacterium amniphilum]MCL9806491.1 hypothetical protein [Flavobacterium amniphilum]